MTFDELKSKPNKEVGEIAAQKVMKWIRNINSWCDNSGHFHYRVTHWNPMKHIEQAFLLCSTLEDRGWFYHIDSPSRNTEYLVHPYRINFQWYRPELKHSKRVTIEFETLSAAITYAAILAIDMEES